MKPKPFTLGRLLEVRLVRQRQREQALAAAARKVRQQEEVVEEAIRQQLAAREGLRSAVGGGGPGRMDVEAARRSRAYLTMLSHRAGQAAARLPALRQIEAAAREELVTARRASRALENLRDRRGEELRRWTGRRVQKTLDELSQSARAVARGSRRPRAATRNAGPEARSGRREP